MTFLYFPLLCWYRVTFIISLNFLSKVLLLCVPVRAGADVPETEAGGGKGEATSRAGALQEVFDAATDTLAERRPLQGLPSQVTPTRRPDGPAGVTPPSD